jgi:serine/threonine protein kinase
VKQKSNYKILSLVGRGQFGKVFVAIERQSGNLVALKELNQKQLSTSSFLRELHFLVTLDHFNIVTCKALEHYQNNRYIVMDYCEGGTLRNLLDSPYKLTLTQSLKLITDILAGLKFAHDKGIIHRDIKPENILLQMSDNHSWTAHISDFGIAKLHQEIHPQTIMGDTGSPAYMAPEQFYGQYSYSCDLYAVGVILYELVVGERPFGGMPKELMAAHLNQPVIIPKTVPFILRSPIAKSLQKLPHRRFQSAGEMLKSLQLVQEILQMEQCTISSAFRYTSVSSVLPLTLVATEVLTAPVTHLAIAAAQVYLGIDDQIQIFSYQDASLGGEIINQWQISLDKPISTLEIRPQGCFITTASSVHCLPQDSNTEAFHFVYETLLPIASFPINKLVSTIDPQGSWLGISYLPHKSQTPAFEIFRLPNCQLKRLPEGYASGLATPRQSPADLLRKRRLGFAHASRSQINCKLWNYLFALDRRYGLGIYLNSKQHTELHLFNRRGHWLANFIVPIQLDLVTHNPLFPQQILGIETNNPDVGILISLERFNLKRIPVKIKPTLITTCPQGYLVSDRSNNVILINGKDFSVSQFLIPLATESTITAIAANLTHLLIASASPTQALLQRFSWN